MGKFQLAIDRAGAAGEAERAARGLQPGEAVHDPPQAAAVELGEPREVQNNPHVICAEEVIESQLELLALDAHLERAAQLQNDDSGLQFFFDDVHGFLPRDLQDFRADGRKFAIAACGSARKNARFPSSAARPKLLRLRTGIRESCGCNPTTRQEEKHPSRWGE